MAQKITASQRAKFARLLNEGVRPRAAGAATGISSSSAARLAADLPFAGGPQPGRANLPAIEWTNDQAPPPPAELVFRPGYHDRSLRSYAAPLAFEGWTIDRIRTAIALHDQGFFLESSLLAIVATRFGPVYAALQQAIAPALALPRIVTGGTRGLARVLKEAVEAQIAPNEGLTPSPYFPPWLWGSAAIILRMMGFAVLQHAYGDEDPETGVRPIYTRLWPNWAVQYQRWRRTYQAITTEGPDDIVSGNGKWTLLADTEEPHLDGAIRALGLEVLDGTMAKAARASYLDKYGNPKWVGIMPEGVGAQSAEGLAMFDAMSTLRGPDGFGVLPFGADFKTESLQATASAVFKDAMDNVWQFVAAILLGSDGTMTRGTGVYSAPIFAGVRRDLVDRMLKCMIRGANSGHIKPWLMFNYAASIQATSGWIDPVVSIPLPDPDADARIKSYSDRVKAFHEIVGAERMAGFEVTQERVNQLAISLNIEAPTLMAMQAVSMIQLAPTDAAKVVRVKEARAAQGLPPLGDERDDLLVRELDAPADTVAHVETVKDGAKVEPVVQDPGANAPDGGTDIATSAAE